MKKLLVLGLALAMVIAFTLPASALESVFGGYWRTRMFHNENFQGDDDIADTGITRVDTRTRLYYTAILNDNLKLVNKFEMDAVWGTGGAQYGDLGADGIAVEVKESFVDANIGPVRAKIGVQDIVLARGFINADEFAGLTLSFKAGDAVIPITWMKINEGGTNLNSKDADAIALYPVFNLGEAFSLNPFIIYAYTDSGEAAASGTTTKISTYGANGIAVGSIDDGVGVYWLGANVDAKLGSASLWFTGVYLGGQLDSTILADDVDVSAFLVAGGASVPVGPVEVHGQAFYASGDDDAADNDAEAFFGIGGGGVGWAYYWSEIMGLGTFDAQWSAGSPNADVSNIWAANIGVTLKPIEKLSLTGDIWYAAHVEDDFVTDEKDLGIEVDLAANYQLVEGLNLRLVGAYLFADDATSTNGQNEDDPYEVGAQLSLAF